MHVLALVNQKGGCGKTTTAVNLAGALAERGEKVLLVDLDPQAHATLALGCAVDGEPSIVDVLRDRVTLNECVHNVAGAFQLVPATAALAEFEEISARMIAPERVLARALERSEMRYEHVIVDCPPRADGILCANALRAADTAMLVIECSTFALQGALKAIAVLEDVAQGSETPFALRAVGTLFDRRMRIARDVLIGMQAQLGDLLFETTIRTSVRLRETAAAGVPVQVLDPKSRAAADFRALADEVCAHAQARTGRPSGPGVPDSTRTPRIQRPAERGGTGARADGGADRRALTGSLPARDVKNVRVARASIVRSSARDGDSASTKTPGGTGDAGREPRVAAASLSGERERIR